jgi:hypothetical protein
MDLERQGMDERGVGMCARSRSCFKAWPYTFLLLDAIFFLVVRLFAIHVLRMPSHFFRLLLFRGTQCIVQVLLQYQLLIGLQSGMLQDQRHLRRLALDQGLLCGMVTIGGNMKYIFKSIWCLESISRNHGLLDGIQL